MLTPGGASTSSHVHLVVSLLTSFAMASCQCSQSGLPRASASFLGSIPAGMLAVMAYGGTSVLPRTALAADMPVIPRGSDRSLASLEVDSSPVRMQHA